MAILKGKDGTVSIGGTALGTVSSFSVSLETETLETTAMGTGGWKTFVGSLQSWNGTVEMYVQTSTDLSGLISGASVAVVLVDTPDGTSATPTVNEDGNTWTGNAIVTSLTHDVSAADLVTVSLDLTGSGELTLY
jgi:predicted secreted protein